jgi:hybrid cluster-associated redox disulfide protein
MAAGIPGLLVADVLSRWPQTAPVFLRRRLACVGCSLARFEQVADVAAIYDLDLAAFLQELQQAIESREPRTKAGAARGRGRKHEG